mgnify:CR=1 FL=1
MNPDERCHRHFLGNFVNNSRDIRRSILTGSFDETSVMLGCQQRIWEITEKLLKKTSNTVNIVEKICWIAEIHF